MPAAPTAEAQNISQGTSGEAVVPKAQEPQKVVMGGVTDAAALAKARELSEIARQGLIADAKKGKYSGVRKGETAAEIDARETIARENTRWFWDGVVANVFVRPASVTKNVVAGIWENRKGLFSKDPQQRYAAGYAIGAKVEQAWHTAENTAQGIRNVIRGIDLSLLPSNWGLRIREDAVGMHADSVRAREELEARILRFYKLHGRMPQVREPVLPTLDPKSPDYAEKLAAQTRIRNQHLEDMRELSGRKTEKNESKFAHKRRQARLRKAARIEAIQQYREIHGELPPSTRKLQVEARKDAIQRLREKYEDPNLFDASGGLRDKTLEREFKALQKQIVADNRQRIRREILKEQAKILKAKYPDYKQQKIREAKEQPPSMRQLRNEAGIWAVEQWKQDHNRQEPRNAYGEFHSNADRLAFARLQQERYTKLLAESSSATAEAYKKSSQVVWKDVAQSLASVTQDQETPDMSAIRGADLLGRTITKEVILPLAKQIRDIKNPAERAAFVDALRMGMPLQEEQLQKIITEVTKGNTELADAIKKRGLDKGLFQTNLLRAAETIANNAETYTDISNLQEGLIQYEWALVATQHSGSINPDAWAHLSESQVRLEKAKDFGLWLGRNARTAASVGVGIIGISTGSAPIAVAGFAIAAGFRIQRSYARSRVLIGQANLHAARAGKRGGQRVSQTPIDEVEKPSREQAARLVIFNEATYGKNSNEAKQAREWLSRNYPNLLQKTIQAGQQQLDKSVTARTLSAGPSQKAQEKVVEEMMNTSQRSVDDFVFGAQEAMSVIATLQKKTDALTENDEAQLKSAIALLAEYQLRVELTQRQALLSKELYGEKGKGESREEKRARKQLQQAEKLDRYYLAAGKYDDIEAALFMGQLEKAIMAYKNVPQFNRAEEKADGTLDIHPVLDVATELQSQRQRAAGRIAVQLRDDLRANKAFISTRATAATAAYALTSVVLGPAETLGSAVGSHAVEAAVGTVTGHAAGLHENLGADVASAYANNSLISGVRGLATNPQSALENLANNAGTGLHHGGILGEVSNSAQNLIQEGQLRIAVVEGKPPVIPTGHESLQEQDAQLALDQQYVQLGGKAENLRLTQDQIGILQGQEAYLQLALQNAPAGSAEASALHEQIALLNKIQVHARIVNPAAPLTTHGGGGAKATMATQTTQNTQQTALNQAARAKMSGAANQPVSGDTYYTEHGVAKGSLHVNIADGAPANATEAFNVRDVFSPGHVHLEVYGADGKNVTAVAFWDPSADNNTGAYLIVQLHNGAIDLDKNGTGMYSVLDANGNTTTTISSGELYSLVVDDKALSQVGSGGASDFSVATQRIFYENSIWGTIDPKKGFEQWATVRGRGGETDWQQANVQVTDTAGSTGSTPTGSGSGTGTGSGQGGSGNGGSNPPGGTTSPTVETPPTINGGEIQINNLTFQAPPGYHWVTALPNNQANLPNAQAYLVNDATNQVQMALAHDPDDAKNFILEKLQVVGTGGQQAYQIDQSALPENLTQVQPDNFGEQYGVPTENIHQEAGGVDALVVATPGAPKTGISDSITIKPVANTDTIPSGASRVEVFYVDGQAYVVQMPAGSNPLTLTAADTTTQITLIGGEPPHTETITSSAFVQEVAGKDITAESGYYNPADGTIHVFATNAQGTQLTQDVDTTGFTESPSPVEIIPQNGIIDITPQEIPGYATYSSAAETIDGVQVKVFDGWDLKQDVNQQQITVNGINENFSLLRNIHSGYINTAFYVDGGHAYVVQVKLPTNGSAYEVVGNPVELPDPVTQNGTVYIPTGEVTDANGNALYIENVQYTAANATETFAPAGAPLINVTAYDGSHWQDVSLVQSGSSTPQPTEVLFDDKTGQPLGTITSDGSYGYTFVVVSYDNTTGTYITGATIDLDNPTTNPANFASDGSLYLRPDMIGQTSWDQEDFITQLTGNSGTLSMRLNGYSVSLGGTDLTLTAAPDGTNNIDITLSNGVTVEGHLVDQGGNLYVQVGEQEILVGNTTGNSTSFTLDSTQIQHAAITNFSGVQGTQGTIPDPSDPTNTQTISVTTFSFPSTSPYTGTITLNSGLYPKIDQNGNITITVDGIQENLIFVNGLNGPEMHIVDPTSRTDFYTINATYDPNTGEVSFDTANLQDIIAQKAPIPEFVLPGDTPAFKTDGSGTLELEESGRNPYTIVSLGGRFYQVEDGKGQIIGGIVWNGKNRDWEFNSYLGSSPIGSTVSVNAQGDTEIIFSQQFPQTFIGTGNHEVTISGGYAVLEKNGKYTTYNDKGVVVATNVQFTGDGKNITFTQRDGTTGHLPVHTNETLSIDSFQDKTPNYEKQVENALEKIKGGVIGVGIAANIAISVVGGFLINRNVRAGRSANKSKFAVLIGSPATLGLVGLAIGFPGSLGLTIAGIAVGAAEGFITNFAANRIGVAPARVVQPTYTTAPTQPNTRPGGGRPGGGRQPNPSRPGPPPANPLNNP